MTRLIGIALGGAIFLAGFTTYGAFFAQTLRVERNICIEYNLAINENLSAETVETIRESLREIAPKIQEVCAAVGKWSAP